MMSATTEKPTISWEEFSRRRDEGMALVTKHPEFAKWKPTSYRALRTRDGAAWTCNLRYNGKPAGDASNGGYGGPDDIRITKEDARASFETLKRVLREYDAEAFKYEIDGSIMDAILTAAGK